jgi:hypothetical protein
MTGMTMLVSKFPQHELTIYRLWKQDTEFRTVCGDYEDALAALRHWEGLEPAAGRAREYRELVSELEEEIMQMVDGKGCA